MTSAVSGNDAAHAMKLPWGGGGTYQWAKQAMAGQTYTGCRSEAHRGCRPDGGAGPSAKVQHPARPEVRQPHPQLLHDLQYERQKDI